MKIGGVIAEYNPFHEGHRYQLEQMRKNGITHIAVAMSGNYVQRGDMAFFPKWTRAKAALLNGADLVIELPTPYAMAPAKDFALAGVSLLSRLGIDVLSFGSECGDLDALSDLAGKLDLLEASYSEEWKGYLTNGYSHAKARELLVKTHLGAEYAELITKPNNLLGLEYIRAAKSLSLSLSFHTISRKEAAHDQTFANGKIASASYLRKELLRNLDKAATYIPDSAAELYFHELTSGNSPYLSENLNLEILSYLRRLTPADFYRMKDVSVEMGNRIYEKVKTAASLLELTESLICKQYSRARVRRILLNCYLSIEKDRFPALPEYIRILGMNEKGEEIIKSASPLIPVSGRMKMLTDSYPTAQFEVFATDLYMMAGRTVRPKGTELTEKLIRLSSVDK